MEALEQRLAPPSARQPGLVAAVGAEALAAGGKRLRPLLVFLSRRRRRAAARRGRRRRARAHGDARPRRPHRRRELRRGRPAAWSEYGAGGGARGRRLPLRPRLRRARRRPATPRGRACSPTPASPRARRGAAAAPAHDPDTTIEALPRALRAEDREALRGGVPARLGRRAGAFGLSLGVAFQIADDILDCAGETIETGKIAGTDLREGTPTLPLLLAAQRGRGRARGARRRPARGRAGPCGRDRRARARRRGGARLRSQSEGVPGRRGHRDELEALAHAVVEGRR